MAKQQIMGPLVYLMFAISLSDTSQWGFTILIYFIPWPAKKIAAKNSHTSLSAKNGQKLCIPHSQLAKAAKNEIQKKIC